MALFFKTSRKLLHLFSCVHKRLLVHLLELGELLFEFSTFCLCGSQGLFQQHTAPVHGNALGQVVRRGMEWEHGEEASLRTAQTPEAVR